MVKPPTATTSARRNTPNAPDQHQRVDTAPCQPGHKECAKILDHLEQRQEPRRQVDFLDPAALDARAVGDADRSADRERTFRIVDERLRGAEQRVRFEDRIAVNDAEDRGSTDVDPGVLCVGLAAILLVYDKQPFGHWRGIQPPDRLMDQRVFIGALETRELESRDEPLQRLVLRSVVDNDDLEVRVFKSEHRMHALHDVQFLIVGRDDQRDWRRNIAVTTPQQRRTGHRGPLGQGVASDQELQKIYGGLRDSRTDYDPGHDGRSKNDLVVPTGDHATFPSPRTSEAMRCVREL